MNEEVRKFLKSLIDPEQYGWAVNQEVRQKVFQILTKYRSENEN